MYSSVVCGLTCSPSDRSASHAPPVAKIRCGKFVAGTGFQQSGDITRYADQVENVVTLMIDLDC